MSIRNLYVVLLAIAVLGSSSCCKKRRICDGEALKVAFTGFDRSTIRNVTLKRYLRGDKTRIKALDSIQLVNNRPITSTTKPDTSWLSDYTLTAIGNGTNNIKYGNDWAIIVTSNNNAGYLIADIFEGDNRYDKVKCSDNDTECTNNIKSYSINGFWVESNTLFIRRQN